jgi:hypothetical protein
MSCKWHFFGSPVTTKTLEGPVLSGDSPDLTFGVTHMKVVSLKITLMSDITARSEIRYSICSMLFGVRCPFGY